MKMKRQKKNCYRLLMMLAVVFFALDVSAQATISGHVKDETGEGVIGASVMVKGDRLRRKLQPAVSVWSNVGVQLHRL